MQTRRKQMKSGQASIVTGSEAEPQKLKYLRKCLHFWLRMTGKELCIFCSTEKCNARNRSKHFASLELIMTAFFAGMSDGKTFSSPLQVDP